VQSNEYKELLSYLESQKPNSNTVIDISKNLKKKEKVVEIKQEKNSIPEEFFDIHADINNYRNNSSVGFNVNLFESLMRARLIDDHKRIQSYERPYISVTELCSCIRESYYKRLKYPVDIKKQYQFSYLYMMQKVGNEIHNIIQDIYNFSEIEKTVVSEIYKVKGRVDAIKDKFLYEIKSVDDNRFKNNYDKEHYFQAIIYVYILNNEYNYNIENVTIIYVFRNLRKVVAFDIKFNSELAKSFLERSTLLQNSIRTKEVPEPIGFTTKQCKYCLYKKFCDKDGSKIKSKIIDKKKEEKQDDVFLL